MNNQPLITIILCTYNRCTFLKEAIKSIQNQSWKNLEIIVVDDGSTDQTKAYLSMIEMNDPRFRIFSNKNQGYTCALNRALQHTSGEYIAIHDDDDRALPQKIEKQFAYLQDHHDIDIVGCGLIIIDENGRELKHFLLPEKHEHLVKIQHLSSPISHVWLARKSVYNKLKEYRINGVEDYDFLLRACSAGFRLANLPLYEMEIRSHEGNTINALGLRQYILKKYVYQLYKERYEKGNDSHSRDKLNNILNVLPPWYSLYNYSRKLFMKANKIKKQNPIYHYLLIFFSLIISPHFFSHLFERYQYQKMINYYRKIEANFLYQ